MKKNAKQDTAQVSPVLRAWTRGLTFTLAMGKTQVATLVSAHLSQHRMYPPVGHSHKLVKQFITAMRGLEERGLIVAHLWDATRIDDKKRRDELAAQPFGRCWQVTEAGEHVVALLKLTGIYDELRAEFEAADVRKRIRLA